jgi:hypothetical protein
MKRLFFFLAFLCITNIGFTQNDSLAVQDSNTYRIVKTDGGEIIGKILSQNEREVLVLTKDNRRIYIPQHVINEIVLLKSSDFNFKGDYIGEDKFATRYFLTTNGLPIKKGEHYVQWSLFGPDIQFALGENLGVGVMTSWIGIPIIGSIKKSWELGARTQFAIGGLLGTGSWALPDFGGALPFATLSFGDRTRNIAFSAGYGAIWDSGDTEGRALMSVAGMIKVSPKISLVFDSFVLLPGKPSTSTYQYYDYNPITGDYQSYTQTYEYQKPGFAILLPGVRWHQAEGRAIQVGFTAIYAEGEVIPAPIPMIQWFRSL